MLVLPVLFPAFVSRAALKQYFQSYSAQSLYCKKMIFPRGICVLACVVSAISSPFEVRTAGSLESFIATESHVALRGILDNVGAGGVKVEGAAAGLVIASPSTNNPDCKA